MLQIECDFVYWLSQIDIMKALLLVSALILVVSCGKYERPFISFKSPEKRLTDGTWGCTKAVDSEGNEFEVEDRITFSIDGTDSTFTRVTTYGPLSSENLTLGSLPYEDTCLGNWTWANAIGDKFNKQMIHMSIPNSSFGRWCRVTVLSNKELVFQDQSHSNTTYHYKKL